MHGNFKSLVEFSQEVERRERAKNDFVVSSDAMYMREDNETLSFGGMDYDVGKIAHEQVASTLEIPRQYYRRIGEIPGLRASNVNALLERFKDEKTGQPVKRMVRTLDGRARAFVSDRFKPIDNFFMLQAVLPVFREHMDLQIKVQGLTESRMYLQAVFPKVQASVVGEIVQAGMIITNSEVSKGAFNIEEFIWKLSCLNGMVGKSLVRRRHVGRRIGESEEDYSIFKDDTLNAELEAYQLKIRDIVAHALDQANFNRKVEDFRRAANDEIERPKAVVENVTKRFQLSEDEGEKMLVNLVKGGQMNRWGLANSITALAHEVENMDRQYEIEKLGHDVIELKPNEWEEVSNERIAS